tara:strand:- start:77 stop:772 length:696 start_codon:yes stop_codon:yes gene_type:complete
MKKIIFSIIPARGGSKSIPNKNMSLLAGKPLIYYSIKKSINCKFFDKIIVSSDSNKILNYSKKFKGIDIIKRPKKYSQDKSLTIETIFHAIKKIKIKYNILPDVIFIIEPTSPFRTKKTLIRSLNLFKTHKNIDSVISVKKSREVRLKIKNNEVVHDTNIRRRQERIPNYFEASTVWATTYKSLKKNNSIIGKKPYPLFVDLIESIDINEKEDLFLSKILMKSLKNEILKN